jgi:hypothetical protein
MKNLENKIKILNENKGENSLSEYIELSASSDNNFFRWLFDEEFEQDFDISLTNEQKKEFEMWLTSMKIDEKLEKYIILRFEGDDDYQITLRSHFEQINLCDCYENYGMKCGCYDSGCYVFKNSGCEIAEDCYKELYHEFEHNNDDEESIWGLVRENLELSYTDFFEMLINDKDVFISNFLLTEEMYIEVKKWFENWKEENETHTQVTAWTYWDGNNFKTVVLSTDFGEPDCFEVDSEESRKILAEFNGALDVFATESKETENYIFTTTLYASDPYLASVEIK